AVEVAGRIAGTRASGRETREAEASGSDVSVAARLSQSAQPIRFNDTKHTRSVLIHDPRRAISGAEKRALSEIGARPHQPVTAWRSHKSQAVVSTVILATSMIVLTCSS
ncbi:MULTISPECIES: hypothetical protein, partial [unclassified Roseobacter]|uniref:hypothetical protein n=1 Tax=unclassified Roseobacter TaxID=196798 RepID=UPI001C0F3289